MNNLKRLCMVLAIAGSACAGDALNILDKFYYPLVYNVPVARECYRRPFDLKKEYKINNGLLEVYFGTENKMYKVNPDLSVNQKSLRELLEERGRIVLKNSKKIISDIVDEILEGY